MKALRAIALACSLVALSASAFALGASAQAQQNRASITVETPWARATPPGAPTGAVYLIVHNGGSSDDRLIAVSTPAAKKADLHTHIMDGDIMKMRAVPNIRIPAGKDVRLAPGGYHVMLTDLNHPLKRGDTLRLTLTFEKAGKIAVTAPILAAGALGPTGAGGHPMSGHGAGMKGMEGMGH
jgi:copper(I)-binding protein